MVMLHVALGCLLEDLLRRRAVDLLTPECFGLGCFPVVLLPPLLLFLLLSPPAVAPPVGLQLLPAVSLPAAAHTAKPTGRPVRVHVYVQQPPGRQQQRTHEAPKPLFPGRPPPAVSGVAPLQTGGL